MITTLREMEVKLGTSDRRDVTSHDKEFKSLEAREDEESKESDKKTKSNQKKIPGKKVITSKYTAGSNREDSHSQNTTIRVYKKGGSI